MKKLHKSVLLKNTVMLYILQFSSYFFSLMTVPYQTRILGPSVYGTIGFAAGVMAYFQLLMDFGFLLSATEDISKHRNERSYINKKLTSVMLLKLILVTVSAAILSILCLFVKRFQADPKLFIIYFSAFAINTFLPDFVYRGIEKMTAITVRTVLIKLFFTCMIFLFLKKREDYLIVPLLLLIGNFGAVFGAYAHLFRKLGYAFEKVPAAALWNDFKRSLSFFFSRIASTVYSSTNIVIIGFIDKVGLVTGYYTSADKIMSTAKNCLSPISDSLYPYMIKNRDYKLVKKILMLVMPVMLVGCVVVGVFAEPLCVLAFGKEYADTAPALVAMIPGIFAILPSFILGFPTLGAMGLSKYANHAVIAGTVTHIVGLSVLFFTGRMTYITLAAMTSVSEWVILLFRVFFIWKNRDRLKSEPTAIVTEDKK